jgi:hypothetical protein
VTTSTARPRGGFGGTGGRGDSDNLGHFPHIESPTAVVAAIEEFIAASPDANDHAPQPYSHSPRRPSISETSEDRRTLDVSASGLADNLKSRRDIEIAIGVLMGLRGCPHNEAVSEFARAVQEMGLSPGELGRALADMAGGNDNSPHQAEVQHRWRHLLALRGFDGDRNGAARGQRVRVRYGPENSSTIC